METLATTVQGHQSLYKPIFNKDVCMIFVFFCFFHAFDTLFYDCVSLICNPFPFGFTASVVKLECNLCINQDAEHLPNSVLLTCQSSLKLQLLWKLPLLMWLQQGKLLLNWNGTRFLLMISGASSIIPLSTKQETMSNVSQISFDCWCMYLCFAF